MSNTVITIKKSSTANKVPLTSDLANGELAINYTDQILYGTNGSVIFELGSNINIQIVRSQLRIGNSTINVFSNSTLLKIANSTTSANLTSVSLNIGTSAVNSTVIAAGANVNLTVLGLNVGNSTANSIVNSTSFFLANSSSSLLITPNQFIGGSPYSIALGNTTVNSYSNSTTIRISNSVANLVLSPNSLITGNTTVNSTIIAVGANVISNTTAIKIGNSTVNTVITAADVTHNGVSIVPFGKQEIYVPATAMIPRSTAGPAIGIVESATTLVMLNTLDFDATANEHCQFSTLMPKSWDRGTLIAQFIWLQANTTTNYGVTWSIAATSFGDAANVAATAFGTEITVSDTGGSNNFIYKTAESSAITVAGSPAAEAIVFFQVKRLPADVNDTMTVDARLLGVKIHYTINAASDS